MAYYNGYSGRERGAKLSRLTKKMRAGEIPVSVGPCEICNDPDVATEYHSEDYSRPYNFAEHSLCRSCHRNWFHKRFSKPLAWESFKAHVQRGGYARDTKNHQIYHQITAYRQALEQGKTPLALPQLRERVITGEEWWLHVHLAPSSLESFDARPRARQDILSAFTLALPRLSEKQKTILTTHYRMSARTASMRELAALLGYAEGNALNIQYGKAARLLLEEADYDAPKRKDGSQKLMMVLCHASQEKSSEDEFQWVMNDSLAWVIEKLNFV
ncbi:MAG: hypothetical protein R8J85_08820 [Mariprofundales bacterium]